MRDRELLNTATQVLTPAELDAYKLAHAGMSQRNIAHHLNISRSAVRARLENAIRKINRARNETS